MYYVERVEIDSLLHIHPIGPRSLPEPNSGSYYFFFNGANLLSVDHYAKQPVKKKRERLLSLAATYPDFLLNRTVKQDEILKGPFGTLYSTKDCTYNSPLVKGSSVIYDASGGNGEEHETPTELITAPKDLPPLTSLSLTRIFLGKPKVIILPASDYVVVSANYEPDGRLGGLHVNKAQGGDNTSGDTGMFGMGLEGTYGIPRRIDIPGYLGSRQLTLPPSTFADFADVAVEHYGYNKIIRVEELSNGVAANPRFFQPSVTPEERTLNPVCDAELKQQAAGFSYTVR
ncbi:MAG: hypothetical protein M3Y72_01825 [Acidobacteriota bacterium]|nr:hypothetical protein [Acidobacteriota bacterium]